MDLAKSQVCGGFLIPSTNPGAIVARIPPNAMEPASLTVTNRDATGILYCKWIPFSQTGQGSLVTNDAGIVIQAGLAYTWDSPPRDAMLLILSSVNGSLAAVDGGWNVPQEAQLL